MLTVWCTRGFNN